jgi:hypothetical protein
LYLRDNADLRPLVLVHAPADAPAAARLADFLETNLPLRVQREDGLLTEELDLVESVEIALSAEAVLVLLSPDSVPTKWDRGRWEPVFFRQQAGTGCQLGFALLRACGFPELIRRNRPFFDLTGDFLPAVRRVNQWLLDPERPTAKPVAEPMEIADLRGRLADRPGSASDVPMADAEAFVVAAERDFLGIHRLDCGYRTLAGVLGHAGRALGLRLPGTVEENRDALERHCAEARELFVFANVREDLRQSLQFDGRASTLFVREEAPLPAPDVESAREAFLGWPRDLNHCADLLGHAYAVLPGLLEEDYETGKRLGWAVLALLRNWERNAEAAEFLDLMHPAAQREHDQQALLRIERELCWLHDTPFTAMPMQPGPAQMSLFQAA